MNLYDISEKNLGLFTDLYELTMLQGYYFYRRNTVAAFEMFFRRQPFDGGYTLCAGLEPLIEKILTLQFGADDLAYLEKTKLFQQEFIEYLRAFRFKGDIYAVEEGEVVFPHEVILRVEANILEAQLLEGMVLNCLGFQSLIATKAARIVEAAQGRTVVEFGLRRAQGIDGALSASRAAFIGGAAATSHVLAGKMFNIPVKGTMAHSWVMSFDSELESFEKYAQLFPQNTTLLVDTYHTLKSGLPKAIAVLKKLKRRGVAHFGIRLDSGDLEYLSKSARSALDRAGLYEAKIMASNELDEYIIAELISKKAPIDYFGVGTNLVTAKGDSALTGVYKLVAIKKGARYESRIKISDHPEKITIPHLKNVVRCYDKKGFMCGDIIVLESEKNELKADTSRILLKNIVKKGELLYTFPSLSILQQRARTNISRLPSGCRRFLNAHIYPVHISRKAVMLRNRLMRKTARAQF